MQTSAERRIRPAVVIAYGDAGRAWLRRLAAACRLMPTLPELLDRRVLQLWAVDTTHEGDVSGDVDAITPTMSPPRLRALLDQGRSATNEAHFPMDLRSVVVLERWSLFDANSRMRIPLRQALAVTQRVHGEAGSASHDFDLDWTALADAVRPPGAVDREIIASVRELIGDRTIADRTLLVDAASATGSIVDEALADHEHQHAALGILGGDVAFPLLDSSSEQRSVLLQGEPHPGSVLPFSAFVLHHRDPELVRALVARLRVGLSRGHPATTPALGVGFDEPLPLLAERDRDEIESARYDPTVARDRRRRAAMGLLQEMFMACNVARAQSVVDATRRAARAIAPLPEAKTEPPAVAVPLSAMAAISGWEGAAIGAVALVIAAASVALLGRARARKPEAQEKMPASPPYLRAEAMREWTSLCDMLGAVLGSWRDQLRAERGPTERGPLSVQAWVQSDAPYDWRLLNVPAHEGDGSRFSERTFGQMAEECIQAYELDITHGEIVDHALERIAQRQLQATPEARRELILRSLDGEPAARVRRAIREAPLLVNTRAPLTLSEVLWVADPSMDAGDALRGLEDAHAQWAVRTLTHADPGRSLRLALGEPVAWSSVLSLSFLK
jgi:hypothetical protein